MEKIAIPKNEEYLKEILPNLEKTINIIKEGLETYSSSIIDKKIRNEISNRVLNKITNDLK